MTEINAAGTVLFWDLDGTIFKNSKRCPSVEEAMRMKKSELIKYNEADYLNPVISDFNLQPEIKYIITGRQNFISELTCNMLEKNGIKPREIIFCGGDGTTATSENKLMVEKIVHIRRICADLYPQKQPLYVDDDSMFSNRLMDAFNNSLKSELRITTCKVDDIAENRILNNANLSNTGKIRQMIDLLYSKYSRGRRDYNIYHIIDRVEAHSDLCLRK